MNFRWNSTTKLETSVYTLRASGKNYVSVAKCAISILNKSGITHRMTESVIHEVATLAAKSQHNRPTKTTTTTAQLTCSHFT